MDFDKLSDILKQAFSFHFKTILKTQELAQDEETLAKILKISKYDNTEWNLNADLKKTGVA